MDLDRLIKSEEERQQDTITLIPSENYVSKEVREVVGSVLMNKYSEGYPGRRYYQGNKVIDEIEKIAIEKAQELFQVPHANVQPLSGSPANTAVLFALCDVGDTVMGMSLAAGGHLTHGHPDITFSGKYFKSVQFGVETNGLINYDEVREIARKEKPKVMIIGTTAYPLELNWQKFGEIADEVDAWLVADISHVAGLIVGGVYQTPVPHAHVITTTTHKTLRGPRGAIIMVTQKGIDRDSTLSKKIDSAVFPGLQGGPHDNTTAGIAQALIEASTPEFHKYARKVVDNARTLASSLKEKGVVLVADGTDSHLMLVNLQSLNLTGNVVAEALEEAGIVVNRNAIPHDPNPPFYPSGIRLGTPAVTTRGMGEHEMKQIALWISNVVDEFKGVVLPKESEKRKTFMNEFKKSITSNALLRETAQSVELLTSKFPLQI